MGRGTHLSNGGIQVIRRASQILEALKDHPDGLSLSQLAEHTGLARSTVHRIVAALAAERMLAAATPNGRVHLGPAMAAFASAAERSLVFELQQLMEALAEEVDETVDLAVLEQDRVRFLHQIPANRRLRAVSAVGATFPAYCTANGKALLARLDPAEVVERLPPRLEALTPHTPTSRERLLGELAEVRATGVAYDREEHTVGICAVGIALPTAGGGSVAISLPLPAQRFYGNEEDVVAPLLALRGSVDR
jgi:DNA-binding IclR family transcriptional regulator